MNIWIPAFVQMASSAATLRLTTVQRGSFFNY